MQTATERLDQLEAFVAKLAARKVILAQDYMDAQELARTPVDPRLAVVTRSLIGSGISEPVSRLFARDVLKALDADAGK